jgi:SNF family Na+-dependent transporter
VIGSLVPDLGYIFGEDRLADFAHKFSGVLGFALPLGLLIIGAWHFLRGPLVRLLPVRWRDWARPVCEAPLGSVWLIVFSLAVGACTHVAWDSFTHKNEWLVQHVSWLQLPVLTWDGRNVRVCHLFWYGSSFAGVAAVFVAYSKWQEQTRGKANAARRKPRLQGALLVALLVLPIELAHHIVHDWQGDILVVAGTLALLAGAVWSTQRKERLQTEN